MRRNSASRTGLVSNPTHVGALGRYAQWIADRGHAAIVIVAGIPLMAYHGSSVASIATSPIAIAVPGPDADSAPLLLDMSTSIIPGGRVSEALAAGIPLPEGAAIDAQGKPTTDAKEAKTLLPIGGAKGSGLSLMFECLTGILAASPIFTAPPGGSGRRAARPIQNAMVVALNVASFRALPDYRADIEKLTGAGEVAAAAGRRRRVAASRRARRPRDGAKNARRHSAAGKARGGVRRDREGIRRGAAAPHVTKAGILRNLSTAAAGRPSRPRAIEPQRSLHEPRRALRTSASRPRRRSSALSSSFAKSVTAFAHSAVERLALRRELQFDEPPVAAMPASPLMSLRRSSADTARDTLAFCIWNVAPITLAVVRGRSAIVVRTTHSACSQPMRRVDHGQGLRGET